MSLAISAARVLAIAGVTLAASCTSPPPCWFEAEAWPDGDGLFRRDPRWRGGDVASSLDLGQDRVLWLFGDSFVGEKRCARATPCGVPGVSPSARSRKLWMVA